MGVLHYSCMQALKLQHPKNKRKEVKIIIILVLHDVFPCNIAMHGMQPLHAVHAASACCACSGILVIEFCEEYASTNISSETADTSSAPAGEVQTAAAGTTGRAGMPYYHDSLLFSYLTHSR